MHALRWDSLDTAKTRSVSPESQRAVSVFEDGVDQRLADDTERCRASHKHPSIERVKREDVHGHFLMLNEMAAWYWTRRGSDSKSLR